VQRMSAGRGVRHSEFNASDSEPVHFLQIWITPDETGIAPGYEQKSFAQADKIGRWCLLVSPDGRGGSLMLHQNALLYAALLGPADRLSYAPVAGRQIYIHVARGAVRLQGERLTAGDAVALRDEALIELSAGEDAEVLLFDL
jgi:redox-sensitive bicupin YhaK (pirin superfamily)